MVLKIMEYNITRSNRKTLAIHITKEATVEVKVPLQVQKTDIDKFVMSKEKWIIKQLVTRREANKLKSKFALRIGDMVLLQGKEYPIETRSGNNISFDGEKFFVPELLEGIEIKDAIIQMYRHLAKKILSQKTIFYANQMGVSPKAVKVNSAKTRWGSCSGKNSLNFSWLLVMADESVIDYVVVHELAHIKEHNHSDRFWNIVATVFPDYKERQQRLKLLQEKLSKEDW